MQAGIGKTISKADLPYDDIDSINNLMYAQRDLAVEQINTCPSAPFDERPGDPKLAPCWEQFSVEFQLTFAQSSGGLSSWILNGGVTGYHFQPKYQTRFDNGI